MTKAVTDILRQKRQYALKQAARMDEVADISEKEVISFRQSAKEFRELHCQLGASIKVLEGDDAILDLPPENAEIIEHSPIPHTPA